MDDKGTDRSQPWFASTPPNPSDRLCHDVGVFAAVQFAAKILRCITLVFELDLSFILYLCVKELASLDRSSRTFVASLN